MKSHGWQTLAKKERGQCKGQIALQIICKQVQHSEGLIKWFPNFLVWQINLPSHWPARATTLYILYGGGTFIRIPHLTWLISEALRSHVSQFGNQESCLPSSKVQRMWQLNHTKISCQQNMHSAEGSWWKTTLKYTLTEHWVECCQTIYGRAETFPPASADPAKQVHQWIKLRQGRWQGMRQGGGKIGRGGCEKEWFWRGDVAHWILSPTAAADTALPPPFSPWNCPSKIKH